MIRTNYSELLDMHCLGHVYKLQNGVNNDLGDIFDCRLPVMKWSILGRWMPNKPYDAPLHLEKIIYKIYR